MRKEEHVKKIIEKSLELDSTEKGLLKRLIGKSANDVYDIITKTLKSKKRKAG